MNIFDAMILGAVQGVTEFLPISSSGHLVIAQHFLKGFEQPGVLFDVVLHFGTLIAVLIYFRDDIIKIVRDICINDKNGKKMGLLIIVGSIPTGIIGILFKDYVEQMFASVLSVAFMLILTGFVLYLTRRFSKSNRKTINFVDALLIGTTQGIAIIPGISRSGITISTGIFKGLDPETVGRFSFLLSIPAILGAVILQLKHVSSLEANALINYAAGAFIALVTGLICINLLMSILKSNRFSLFAYYCWGTGIITILLNI